MASKRATKKTRGRKRGGFRRDKRYPHNIGTLIRTARRAVGIKREELAPRAGITVFRLKELERNLLQNPNTIDAVLAVLNPALVERGHPPILHHTQAMELTGSWLSMPTWEWQPGTHGPAALLNAEFQVVKFHGVEREAEVEGLIRWCRLDSPASVRIYKGGAGMGKTRLALELCKRLRESKAEPWTVGFVDPTQFPMIGNPWTRNCDSRQPTLVVVDYAGDKTKIIERLLEELQKCPSPRLRLLCLDRDDLWLGRLRDRQQRLFDFQHSHAGFVVDLKPMASTVAERKETFRIAATEFARRLRVTPPRRLSAGLGGSIYNQVLFIHMKALLAVFGAKAKDRQSSILLHVLDREREFWSRQIAARGLQKPLRLAVEEAVHCISEHDGVGTVRKAERMLRQEPLLLDQPAVVVREIVRDGPQN